MKNCIIILHKLVGMCIIFFIIGCSSSNNNENINTVCFDVNKSYPIKLSEIIDSIYILPLETNDSCLIKDIKSVELHNNIFYINDNSERVVAFKEDGSFLFSTESKKGYGPENYFSCIGFTVMENGDIEIFDALRYGLKRYSNKMEFIEELKIPKDILPVVDYLRLSDDLILFDGSDNFKLYSCSKQKIFKKINISNLGHKVPRISQNLSIQMYRNNIYYSPLYPDANLYKYDYSKQEITPYISFRFPGHDWDPSIIEGMKGNLNNYFLDHPEYAFVADKIIHSNGVLCFFIYDKKMCIGYSNNGINKVYYNMPRGKGQLMQPYLVSADCLYYFSEPDLLPYLIDENLLSEKSSQYINKMKSDDNPLIICYKLKR